MKERTRNILGQILLVGSILLVVIWFIAMRVISINLDPMCYPQLFDLLELIAPVVMIVAVIAFSVGAFLLMSTGNSDGSDKH